MGIPKQAAISNSIGHQLHNEEYLPLSYYVFDKIPWHFVRLGRGIDAVLTVIVAPALPALLQHGVSCESNSMFFLSTRHYTPV
jgi:hypothetical protein